MTDRFMHLPTSVDEALLEATRIGMLAEQTGLPLLPWQQRAIDLACIVDRTGARPHRRPQVRTSTPSEPYHPPKRNPLDPWWDRFAGLACTCPPRCTDRTWGDGGTCARNCVPCREMQGAPYVPKPKSKKAAPGGQVNTTEESDAA